tara:strand:- start:221 stop:925 length:705 start_codon:yes stop_codon:yes gene_type:complete
MSNIDHKAVMSEADKITATAGVKVKGNKKYLMVKDRVEIFRRHYGLNLGIDTTVLHIDENVVRVQAKIIDANNKVIGSGLAEEVRSSSHITKTSALEVCESSSIGRALSSIGLHGGEYASAEEMISAVQQQEKVKDTLQDDLVKIKDTFPNSSIVEKEPTTRDHDPIDDFHPKQNWSAWFDIQMSTIVKFKYKAELRKYFESNKKVFTEYKEQDAKKCGILMDLINKKNKELEI